LILRLDTDAWPWRWLEASGIDQTLDIELEASPSAPSAARVALERFKGLIPDRRLFHLQLVVSELVTNSVVHGPGGTIHVSVDVAPYGRVRGEVSDDGDGEIAIREINDPREGGHGLRIVDSIVDRWGVYDGSTHVWFELA
jgi:anti-sigma regulatory factor (Ser/Thr protein kinase)